MNNPNIQLILGGARSGKSKLAESLAIDCGLIVHYLATAENKDAEMTSRIEQHQSSRPSHWLLSEEPLYLAQKLEQIITTNTCVLVDCLTLWLSNWLCSEYSLEQWQQQKQKLLAVLQKASDSNCNVILVSNEVGHGIVPLGELSRVFVDESGWLHQDIAKIASKVEFVMAGLPLTLKSSEIKSTAGKS
jgi:adenosylcobinamide kinase/adenosylcobinamide-phosphate guanylyltransferase